MPENVSAAQAADVLFVVSASVQTSSLQAVPVQKQDFPEALTWH